MKSTEILRSDDLVKRLALSSFASSARPRDDRNFREILDILPAAIYITDAAGRITYFNEAAAALWGRRPELGTDEWCGSWKLYWPDLRPMPHDRCPMAIALKESRIVRGVEAIAERPDGTRVPFIPFPTLLHDDAGEVIGAVNMLVDITEHKNAEAAAHRLAAIVESSDDAIISKNLDGVILSWNVGAERLFGYSAEETIGRPVTMLIPEERHDEEPEILGRIRRGERIEHYETIRRRKDGSLVELSLTVSPIRDASGKVIGASKIARDITERRRSQEQQKLLIREMDHRIKNLFALSSGVVTLSARSAKTPQELASAVRARLDALARAQSLTLPSMVDGPHGTEQSTTLQALIETIVSPYNGETDDGRSRVVIGGCDHAISNGLVTSFALLLHEFTTNAAKYGALSTLAGHVDVDCSIDGDQFVLTWKESGGPRIDAPPTEEGFGSLMARTTVKGQLGGEISRDWRPEGLTIRLSVPRERLGG